MIAHANKTVITVQSRPKTFNMVKESDDSVFISLFHE